MLPSYFDVFDQYDEGDLDLAIELLSRRAERALGSGQDELCDSISLLLLAARITRITRKAPYTQEVPDGETHLVEPPF